MKTHWLYGEGPSKTLKFAHEVDVETDCARCIHQDVCDRATEKRCQNYKFGTSGASGCNGCSHRFTRYDKDPVPCFSCPSFKAQEEVVQPSLARGRIVVSCTCGQSIVQPDLQTGIAVAPPTCPRCGAAERYPVQATDYVARPWEELDARRKMHGVFNAEGESADPIAIFRTEDAASDWLDGQRTAPEDRAQITPATDVTIMPIFQLDGIAWNSHEPLPIHGPRVDPIEPPGAEAEPQKCPRCWFTPCRQMFQCASPATATTTDDEDLDREIQMMEAEGYVGDRWQRGLTWLRDLRDRRAAARRAGHDAPVELSSPHPREDDA